MLFVLQSWNDDLALAAREYASRCLLESNPNRAVDQSFTTVGENLYAGTGRPDYSTVLTEWFNEKQNFEYENNTCRLGAMCEHYTQVRTTLKHTLFSFLSHTYMPKYDCRWCCLHPPTWVVDCAAVQIWMIQFQMLTF